MKKNVPIKHLKYGDVIYIEFGFKKHKAKVIDNDADGVPPSIILKIKLISFLGIWIDYMYKKIDYNDYHLSNYEAFNYNNKK